MKYLLLNYQFLEVIYALRRATHASLDDDQRLAISVEDELIMLRKLRKEPPKAKASTSGTKNSEQLVQKLVNDMLTIKKQLVQNIPYKDIS